MLYPSINKLLESTDSRYSLVIAVAKRARQISDKAEQNHEVLNEKPVKLAIGDIADHKVNIVVHEHTEEEMETESSHGDALFGEDVLLSEEDEEVQYGTNIRSDDESSEDADNE